MVEHAALLPSRFVQYASPFGPLSQKQISVQPPVPAEISFASVGSHWIAWTTCAVVVVAIAAVVVDSVDVAGSVVVIGVAVVLDSVVVVVSAVVLVVIVVVLLVV